MFVSPEVDVFTWANAEESPPQIFIGTVIGRSESLLASLVGVGGPVEDDLA